MRLDAATAVWALALPKESVHEQTEAMGMEGNRTAEVMDGYHETSS